jgi:putative flippase GtrA
MKRVKRLAYVAYTSHVMRYLFVGFTTFAIDFTILFLLHGVLEANLILATSVAYWVSVSYNFCLNRWWTFSSNDKKSLRKNIVYYAILLAFNYAFTVVFVNVVSSFSNYGVAKVLAVGLSICWTFPIYKYVIFTSSPAETSK